MQFGLTPDHYQTLTRLLIDKLKSKDAKVFIFGSRARNTHHPFSDIDIFYIENPKSAMTSSELALIREELEESNLPIKVDLVKYEDLAKSYLPSIEKDKIEI